jgi:hypothetical protein
LEPSRKAYTYFMGVPILRLVRDIVQRGARGTR